MLRVGRLLCLVFVAPLFACAPPVLRELPPAEQRELGEAAVADVCSYALDVESDITLRQRYQLSVARQYLDDIVTPQVTEGGLSRFFTQDTLTACVLALEWGGVNFDVQRLVERYGTDAEKHEQQRRDCELYAAYRRDPTCEALGFTGRSY